MKKPYEYIANMLDIAAKNTIEHINIMLYDYDLPTDVLEACTCFKNDLREYSANVKTAIFIPSRAAAENATNDFHHIFSNFLQKTSTYNIKLTFAEHLKNFLDKIKNFLLGEKYKPTNGEFFSQRESTLALQQKLDNILGIMIYNANYITQQDSFDF